MAVYDHDGRLINLRLSKDQAWRLPPPSSATVQRWNQALMCIEDRHFYFHPGVDFLAAIRAVYQLVNGGRLISGASTIPMQLARMIHRLPRNFSSKLIEALDALVLSMLYSKQQLLMHYATLAPMGGNIEGVETGSRAYFMRGPNELNWREISQLVLLPQSPSRLFKWNSNDWMNATTKILHRLNQCGVINTEQLQAALSQTIQSLQYHKFPTMTQHVADVLSDSFSNQNEFNTNIDLSIQRQIQALVSRQRNGFFAKAINNIAIGVTEIASGKIKALIGNFDYQLDHNEQKIAAFDVQRSPGSTLKPLIFALAIDDQILLPDTLVEDIPARYGKYEPSNFDANFSGLVRAKTALSQSLNIPFIDLLSKIGMERMTQALARAGVSRRTPDASLGLSMAVGGIDIHFLDLLALYAGLANQGKAVKLHILKSDQEVARSETEFISEAAAYLTTEALKQRDRPEAETLHQALGSDRSIAWKTGTSQNRMDAWSIGYDDKYAVAVWLGNLNRSTSRNLVGSEAAAPVMFDIFAMLRPTGKLQKSEGSPISVSDVEVCAMSGMLPGPACESRTLIPAANGKFPPHRCKYHRFALIDQNNGMEISMHCASNRNIQRKTVVSFPQPIRRWLSSSWNAVLETGIGLDPTCPPENHANANLKIESPKQNSRLRLLASSESEFLTLPFRVSGGSVSEPLTCYINGTRQDLNAHDVLMLRTGRHEVFCSDRHANAAKSVFWIEGPEIAKAAEQEHKSVSKFR